MQNIFKIVKSAVTPRQAAEAYGLAIGRNDMARCPFHNDKTPSMKLYEDHFYCFGCGAAGDVVTLTAQLLGLGPYEAAKRLARDFGLDPDRPPTAAALPKPRVPGPQRVPASADPVAGGIRAEKSVGGVGPALRGGTSRSGSRHLFCGLLH